MDDPSPEFSMQPSITLVVPVFNEASALRTTLPEFVTFCQSRDWNLIVVNDGSTDESKELLSKYENHDHVTVLHHKLNHGYGGALKTGIANVTTDFVVTVDADGQHVLTDIDALYQECLQQDADMVVGDRGRQRSSLFREIGKWMIRKIIRVVLPIHIRDVNSGMKLYRTDLAKRYASLCPDTMAFSDIVTLTFISERHLVTECPITIRKRQRGTSTISVHTAFDTVLKILIIVTMFNPMRLFLPIACGFILAGVLWGLPLVLQERGVSVGAMLAITTGIICFFLGLMAELLSSIRKSQVD